MQFKAVTFDFPGRRCPQGPIRMHSSPGMLNGETLNTLPDIGFRPHTGMGLNRNLSWAVPCSGTYAVPRAASGTKMLHCILTTLSCE